MVTENFKNGSQIFMITKEDLQSVFSSMMAEFMEQLKANENKSTTKENLLSTEEVRAIFHVQNTALWMWAKRGYLKPIKLGNKNYYKQSDINALLNERQNTL